MNINKLQNAIIFGFDSAWTDRVKGAICSMSFDADHRQKFCEPELVSFSEATEFIEEKSKGLSYCLVALDQPTIVNNTTGSRPVDKIAASLISFVGGGVQPANKSKKAMFGPEAPIWIFKDKLKAKDDPEQAQSAVDGNFLIEVFPALTLTAWNPKFAQRLGAPKYNPANRRRFNMNDWLAVHSTIEQKATKMGLSSVADWVRGSSKNIAPRKADQDKLDSIICLMAGITWRVGNISDSMLLGDVDTGFIATPVSEETRVRLEKAKCRNRL
jgi:predicted RNase H-like nuclease